MHLVFDGAAVFDALMNEIQVVQMEMGTCTPVMWIAPEKAGSHPLCPCLPNLFETSTPPPCPMWSGAYIEKVAGSGLHGALRLLLENQHPIAKCVNNMACHRNKDEPKQVSI